MSLGKYFEIKKSKKEFLLKLTDKPLKLLISDLAESSILRETVEKLEKEGKIIIVPDTMSCYLYISKC